MQSAGGPAAPQTLGRGACSEASHSGGRGSCWRRRRKAGRSCHLGPHQFPPNGHSTGGCTAESATNPFPTPALLSRPVVLGDPLPSLSATLPPHKAQPLLLWLWAPRRERTPKRANHTDSGQGVWPGVRPRPEPDSSQPDKLERRKQEGLRDESKTQPPTPTRGSSDTLGELGHQPGFHHQSV